MCREWNQRRTRSRFSTSGGRMCPCLRFQWLRLCRTHRRSATTWCPFPRSSSKAPVQVMATAIHDQTVAALSGMLDRRELSAEELVRALIARKEAVEERIKAFNSLDAESALAEARASDARRQAGEARGPLDGIPVGMK